MSKSVWAVSSGSYSDYRVLVICPTEKVAEAILAADIGEFVEQMPWVDSVEETVPQVTLFKVRINLKGEETHRWKNVEPAYRRFEPDPEVSENDPGYLPDPWINGTSLRGYNVALKAARDKLAQRSAEEAGH